MILRLPGRLARRAATGLPVLRLPAELLHRHDETADDEFLAVLEAALREPVPDDTPHRGCIR